jgi:lipopolysaccharide assembly protein A
MFAGHTGREISMRWIHTTVIVIFAAATVIFALQNLESVRLSFLTFSLNVPLAIQVFVIYALGAVTGGSLFALLRRSYAGVRGEHHDPAVGRNR